MSKSLEQVIRDLRSLFWSERDPEGRGFAPLADAYRRAGELEEALDLLSEGLDRHPEFASAHVVAAWVSRDRGDLDEARASFQRVLELDRENVAALRGLGEMAEEQGRTDEALSHYRNLLELEPGAADLAERVRRLSGETVSEPTGWEPADEVALGTPEGAPEGAELPGEELDELDLAGAAAELGGDERDWAQEGLDEDQEDEVYTATMAELYVRQGLYERAATVYRRLLEADPENASFLERLDEIRAMPEASSEAPAEGWAEEEAEEVAAPVGERRTVGSYLEDLLAWVPGAVPIESLVPESVAMEGAVEAPSLAEAEPGEAPEDEIEAVPVESLAPEAPPEAAEEAAWGPPDETPVSTVEAVPIDSLAPEEEVPGGQTEAVSIESLAPQEPGGGDGLGGALEEPPDAEASRPEPPEADEPDPALNDVLGRIDALGGEDAGDGEEDEDMDDFRKWLDSMGQ